MKKEIKINMSPRTKTAGVEYVPFKKVTISRESKVFTQMMERKVVKVRNIQKIKKIMKTMATVTGVSLSMGTRAFASGLSGATPILNPITPGVIIEYGLQLAFISISVAVGLAMVLLTVSGMLRMLRRKQEASEMSNDVVKGLVQVLISIPSVYLIYKIASYLFRNLNFLSLGF